jgi:hypothetical protein
MTEWFNMNSAPKDGTRIRVMHELDPWSEQNDVTAVWEKRSWACSEYFLSPRGLLFSLIPRA